jgi:hypothetical protein
LIDRKTTQEINLEMTEIQAKDNLNACPELEGRINFSLLPTFSMVEAS